MPNASDDDIDDEAGLDLLRQIRREHRGQSESRDVRLEQDVVAHFLAKALARQYGQTAAERMPKRRDMSFSYIRETYPAFPLVMEATRMQSVDDSALASAFYSGEDSFLVGKFVAFQGLHGLSKHGKLAVMFRGSRKRDFSIMALHNIREFPRGGLLHHGFVYWPKAQVVLEPISNLFERIGTGWIT